MRTLAEAALAMALTAALALTGARAQAQDDRAVAPADPAGRPEPAPRDAPLPEVLPEEPPGEAPPEVPSEAPREPSVEAPVDPTTAPPQAMPAALGATAPAEPASEPRAIRQRTSADDQADAVAMPEAGGVGVPLHIDAAEGLAIHVSARPGERGVRLCLGPCATRVAPGNYYFGIGSEDGSATMDPEARSVLDPSRLRIGYENRAPLRTIGGLVLGVAIAAAVTSIVGVVVETNRDAEIAYLSVGIGGLALFAGVSLPLLFLNDSLTVAIEPEGAVP